MIVVLLFVLCILNDILASFMVIIGLACVSLLALKLICVFIGLLPAFALMLLFLGASWLYTKAKKHWKSISSSFLYVSYLALVFFSMWIAEAPIDHSCMSSFSYIMTIIAAIVMLPMLRLVAEELGLNVKSDCLFTLLCCLLSLGMTVIGYPDISCFRSLELTLSISSLAGAGSAFLRAFYLEKDSVTTEKGE